MSYGSRGGLGAAVLAAVLGCAPQISATMPAEPPRGAVRIDRAELGECERRLRPADQTIEAPIEDPSLAGLLAAVPAEVRRVARAARMERLLAEYLRSAGERGEAALSVRVQVITHLSSLEIEVASLLFETQCVGNQMEAALHEIDAYRRRREVALTVTSLVLTATAATVGGFWDLRDPGSRGPAILGVAGGVTGAALGLSAFAPERRAVVYPHRHNILRPIAVGVDPEGLYPGFVFRLLTLPLPAGGPTPREEILEDWQKILAEIPSARRPLAEEVLYGGGGLYDRDLVDVRERMYDVLESHLNAVDHDLELLYRFTTGRGAG